MMLSKLVEDLQELMTTSGDMPVVVRSQENEFDLVAWTDLIEFQNERCLLLG